MTFPALHVRKWEKDKTRIGFYIIVYRCRLCNDTGIIFNQNILVFFSLYKQKNVLK